MALKDYIKDITTYVISTGFFDKIKLTATTDNVIVQTYNQVSQDSWLYGEFAEPLPDLVGECGLSNLSLLQTICNDPEFSHKDTSMSVVYETRNNERTPTELAYQNKSNSFINYRFMDKQLIPQQFDLDNQTEWAVSLVPTKSAIQQLAWAANGLGSLQQNSFRPLVSDGNLLFFIGEQNAATQRGGVVFATDITDKYESPFRWNVQPILTVLKIAESCDCEMSFSASGKAIRITLNTGLSVYQYIFPCQTN